MKREYRLVESPVGGYVGAARLVVTAEGFSMVRRRGCSPFIVREEAWNDAQPCTPEGKPL